MAADLVPPDFDPNAGGDAQPGQAGAPPDGDQPGMIPDDGGASPQGAPTNGDLPDPADTDPASAQGQAVDGADDGGPRAVGTAEDAQQALLEKDPTAEVDASPDDQAQYDQFVSRFLLFISDQRKSHDKAPSPMQSVLSMLNNPKVPLAIAIGQTTAHVAAIIVGAAMAQKVNYDDDVLFHAAEEVVPAVYLLGSAHGIFKGMPPFHQMEPDGSYEFTDPEIKVLGDARMQAARAYGNIALKNGWISSDERTQASDMWQKQIKREVESGSVSSEMMQKLSQDGVFNKIHDKLGMTGSAGAVAPQMGDDQSNPMGDEPAPSPDASAAPAPADQGAAPAPDMIPAEASGAPQP